MNKVHDVPAQEPVAAEVAGDGEAPPEAPRRRRTRKSAESATAPQESGHAKIGRFCEKRIRKVSEP